jgi:hypothetical protein
MLLFMRPSIEAAAVHRRCVGTSFQQPSTIPRETQLRRCNRYTAEDLPRIELFNMQGLQAAMHNNLW